MRYLRITFGILFILLIASIAFLLREIKEGETRWVMHPGNAYEWIYPDLGWATPSKVGDEQEKDPPYRYGFDLLYPAGYAELIVVPQHTEVCVYAKNYKKTCTPYELWKGE